jgi:uncharacterized protein (TIGR03437 family)
VFRLVRSSLLFGFAVLSVCGSAQTRRNADVRATAVLDTIAQQPESHAVDRHAKPREIFEPERAVRRRNSGAMAARRSVISREPNTLPKAAVIVPPVFNGFPGLADNFTAYPPDTMGAVGPRDVMTMLNSQVTIQSRTGVTRSGYPIALNAFWSPLGPFAGNSSPFDPRLLYDAAADRWIATALANAETANSALLLAVSRTGDPGSKWNYYKVTIGNSTVWGDFPCLGFNANWIVVSTNMFKITGSEGYVTTNLYVFSKSDLSDGGTGSHVSFSDSQGELTTAVDLDNSSPSTLYLVQALPTDFAPVAGQGAIRISKLQGPVGSESFRGGDSVINIADPWSDTGPSDGDFAPQAGTTVRVDTGDSRLGNCVLRAGNIWCAHTIYLPYSRPTRTAAQWFQVDTKGIAPSLVQRGRVDDPSNVYYYAYPSIAVNKSNDAMLGYTRFSANDYPTAEFSYRVASDPLNVMQPDTVFKQGEASYVTTGMRTGLNRWGDFSATVVDPTNDLNFWTIQEYAATPPPDHSSAFGTWWTQVVAPSSGLRCTYTVEAAARAFDSSGGMGAASVATGNGCLWQAASNTNWINVTAGTPASGGGTIQYTVAAAGGAILPRSGTITIAGQTFTVTQSAPSVVAPVFTAQGIVNAASFQGGGVAPGELVTLFGSGLGPGTLQQPLVSTTGVVDTIAGGTRVLFDGVAAPMIYAASGQISTVVPFSLQGHSSTLVQAEFLGTRSTPVSVPIAASAPAIFTADSSGKGQGAILNQDASINSSSRPAAAGSVIVIYLTGAGAMMTPVTDGVLAQGTALIAQDPTVHIGGIPVKPSYAGAAPGIIQGVVQLNVTVPIGVAPGNSVPVDVTIGGVTSPSGVTVAIR